MSRHIIYIINPVSGTKKKQGLTRLIEGETLSRTIPFQIFPSVASGDYSFLEDVIKESAATDVVIAGGDGTISQVVSSLMDTKVNFGIIPCGSGNGLALAAKIPKNPTQALHIIFDGKPVAIDGFYINEYFSCMLCGLGFDAKVAHDFAKQPRRGLTTYVRMVVKNYFAAKPYFFDVALAGQSFRTEAYFISIANSNQFGNNFTIAPKASLRDGLLDIVIVTDQNKLSLLVQALKQVLGKNPLQKNSITSSKKGVIYFQTDQLKIINNGSAPLHIDGDPAETAEKFEIKVSKRCFRLWLPH